MAYQPFILSAIMSMAIFLSFGAAAQPASLECLRGSGLRCETALGRLHMPLRIVVGWKEGGPTEAEAQSFRPVADALLGQNVSIESKPGKGGMDAAEQVARATMADGKFSALFTHEALAFGIARYDGLSFDPTGLQPTLPSLKPVGLMMQAPMVLIARTKPRAGRPAIPSTMAELIAELKKDPSKFRAAHAGVGSNSHRCLLAIVHYLLGGRWLGVMRGEGGYPSSREALLKVGEGFEDLVCDQSKAAAPFIKSDHVKAIAVFAEHAVPALPGVPTARRAGYPHLTIASWHGILMPSDTPGFVSDQVNAAMRDYVERDGVVQGWQEYGIKPATRDVGTPKAHQNWLLDEIAAAKALFNAHGISKLDWATGKRIVEKR